MILGAGIYQVPIIERAKARGIYTIAVSPDGNYPGLKIADKVYYYDVRDEKKVLEAAVAEQIDGIITDQTDVAVRTVAYVAERMGLPGIGYETAKLFTDKNLMREKSRQLGLPTIPSWKVSSIEEALEKFRHLGAEAIIKPVDSQGSRGVYRIDSTEALLEKYILSERFSRAGDVIIEKYINGTEFEVDSIVADYKAETLMYADLEPYKVEGIFASTTRLYPSIESEEVVEKLLDINKRTIEGFGLKQGLTHSEYMRDQDGEIYLIEAAARGGGTFISSKIAELQSGINTSDFLIDIALGLRNTVPEFKRNLCHSGYVTFYLSEGEIVGDKGVDEVLAMDCVCLSTLNTISVGVKTQSFTDKTSRYAIIVKGDSRAELLDNINRIRDCLKIEVKTVTGIKGPIWK